MSHLDEIKIIAGNSNKQLAENVAKALGRKLCDVNVATFSDGETKIEINETLREYNTFIIQSTCNPTNTNLVEFLLLIDAAKRCSAKHVSAVAPYYGYSRQDRMVGRSPISAKAVADWIHAAGADHFLSFDLHSEAIEGFFDMPVDNMSGIFVMKDYFTAEGFKDNENAIIVSPDVGGVKRARNFAYRLGLPIAIVDKIRPKPNVSEVGHVVGDVEGKDCILIDDIVDTAGSLTKAASLLEKRGAASVRAACTHPVLSGPAFERIEESPIKELVVTDTIPLRHGHPKKITQLTIAPMLADCIGKLYTNNSLTDLFVKG